MSITYFKRFRMEIGLHDLPGSPSLPEGYFWIPWQEDLLEVHSEVKFCCFHGEIDAAVFPSLSDRDGCHYLMREITRKPGFLPESTWLIACPTGYCATVQGVRDRTGLGAIQNLGVMPAYRGRGLGRALLLQALDGFRRHGLHSAFLEVTAQNEAAVRLYRQVGFRYRKTIYKAVETRHFAPIGPDLS